jgi:hypothetical protein
MEKNDSFPFHTMGVRHFFSQSDLEGVKFTLIHVMLIGQYTNS